MAPAKNRERYTGPLPTYPLGDRSPVAPVAGLDAAKQAKADMEPLQALRMQKGWIYEAIVSTFSLGVPHAAPIGTWTDNFTTVRMEIYKGSQTLQNILQHKQFAVNFVAEMHTFHAALFRKTSLAYEQAQEVDAPILRNAAAIVELTLENMEDMRNRVRIEAKVVHTHVRHKIKLINRAESLLLESLILATRLPYFEESKIKDSLKENYRVICKVAPGSEHQVTMEQLMESLGMRL